MFLRVAISAGNWLWPSAAATRGGPRGRGVGEQVRPAGMCACELLTLSINNRFINRYYILTRQTNLTYFINYDPIII